MEPKMNEFDLRKYLNNKFDTQTQLEKIKSYKNAFGTNLYDQNQHDVFQIKVLPDRTITPAKFIPTLNPKEYKAHPSTIKAMRKEIFMAGEDFIDLECKIICESCKNEVDKQFWYCCPFCEASFPL